MATVGVKGLNRHLPPQHIQRTKALF